MKKQFVGIFIGLVVLVGLIVGITHTVNKSNHQEELSRSLYNKVRDEELSGDLGKKPLLTFEQESGVQTTSKEDHKLQKSYIHSLQCDSIDITTVYLIASGDTLNEASRVFGGYPFIITYYKSGKFMSTADYYDYNKKIMVQLEAVNGIVKTNNIYYYGDGEMLNITKSYPPILDNN